MARKEISLFKRDIDYRFEFRQSDYGFDLYQVTPQGEKCVACFGDCPSGCVVAQNNGNGTAKIKYMLPFSVPEPIKYPSRWWLDNAKQYYMYKKTKNGRIFFAKALPQKFDNDERPAGVRLLCAETPDSEPLHVAEIEMDYQNMDSPPHVKIYLAGIPINP